MFKLNDPNNKISSVTGDVMYVDFDPPCIGRYVEYGIKILWTGTRVNPKVDPRGICVAH